MEIEGIDESITEMESIKDIETLPINLWIHMLIRNIINSTMNKEAFILNVEVFEKACLEAGWVKKEEYAKKLEEDKEINDLKQTKATTKEEIENKNFLIAAKKFALLLGGLTARKPREIAIVV